MNIPSSAWETWYINSPRIPSIDQASGLRRPA